MATEWYYRLNDRPVGPVSPSVLKRLANDGVVSPKTLVKRQEDVKWFAARRVRGLFSIGQSTAASAPPVERRTSPAADGGGHRNATGGLRKDDAASDGDIPKRSAKSAATPRDIPVECSRDLVPKSPVQIVISLIALVLPGGIVLLVCVVMCIGQWMENNRREYDRRLTTEIQAQERASRDPRDRRWRGNEEFIRAAADEAGVSEAEVKRAFNDELDRRGLGDWADGKE